MRLTTFVLASLITLLVFAMAVLIVIVAKSGRAAELTMQSEIAGGGSHREGDDAYKGVVVVLNERFRVIESRDNAPYRQWILQRNRSVEKPNQWQGESYTQRRTTLLRCIREKVKGRVLPEALGVIERLPDMIEGCKVLPVEKSGLDSTAQERPGDDPNQRGAGRSPSDFTD